MSNLSLVNKTGNAGATSNTNKTLTANNTGNYGTVAGSDTNKSNNNNSSNNNQTVTVSANTNIEDESAGLLVSTDLEMADVKLEDEESDDDSDLDPEDIESMASQMLKKTNLALLKKSSTMVMYFFAGVSAASVICVIFGLLNFEVFELDTIWVMILINLCGSSFGAYGAYKWGTVEETINDMSKQNDQFRSSMMSLDISKGRLQNSVKELSESTRNLRQNSNEIKENLKSFEQVYASLKGVNAQSTDIYNAIDGINDMFSAMEDSIRVSKRATLMNIYYQVSFLCDNRRHRSTNQGNRTASADPGSGHKHSDSAVGLCSDEYEELLALLNEEEREMFEEFGTFEELAGSDGIIDVFEFQQLIDRAIRKLEQNGSFDLRRSFNEN